jgi:methionyl-tRNA formyltransferase
MRLAFLGTPDFAVPALRALHAAGHEVAAVYCQPPRPSGRGQMVRRSPVQEVADSLGLEVRTPASLRRDPATQAAFAALALDAAVVVAYGLLLPEPMLAAPRRGCLNIHASLLPRWRGAAPIQAAILAGDTETGVTIMRMDAGLDTGPMLLRHSVAITDDTTAAALHDDLSRLGAALVSRALAEDPPEVAQPVEGVTYAAKLSRADATLDWRLDAAALARRVRALNPWPGTVTTLDAQPLKITAASVEHGGGEPGLVLDDRLLVATGDGALRLLEVQVPGRAALPAAAFLRGRKVPAGTRLGERRPG